jgi:hypothetical protein
MATTATTTSLIQSAVSPDGSVVAIVAPPSVSSASRRHVIQIYQVSDTATSLQLTLTHTSSLSLLQLIFVGKSLVLGLFGRHEVVVWDLNRGVVATKLSTTSDEHFFLALSSDTTSDDYYYLLTRHGLKLLVHEYQSVNHKLLRKIKSGRLHGDDDEDDDYDNNIDPPRGDAHHKACRIASMVVTLSHLAVRTRESGIRIMAKDTGKKVGKVKIKALHDSTETTLLMTGCRGDSNILATAQDAIGENTTTVLYDMTSCQEIARVVSPKKLTSTDHGISSLQLMAMTTNNGERQYTLLRNDTLWLVDPSSSFQILTQFSSENFVALVLKSDKVLALMYQQQGAECRSRWITYASGNGDTFSLPQIYSLDQPPAEEEQRDIRATTKKRKPIETTVLGPGQAGSEIAVSVKKIKVTSEEELIDAEEIGNASTADDENDDSANMTIAERLAMLKEALDDNDDDDDDEDDGMEDNEESDEFVSTNKPIISLKSKIATTESLKELLSQALQSSDDSLLELALTVRDVTIIATTLKEMDQDLLVILLGKLTSRLASSPLRAESLSVWISHCLKRGTFHPDHLAVLRNLLHERLESLPDLLRLEGRLSMMVD